MKNTIKFLALFMILLANGCSKNSGEVETDLDFTGNWFGTFAGDDTGTFGSYIYPDGNVTGSITSFNLQENNLPLNGKVDASGAFTAVIVITGNNRSFTGKFNASGGSGTWQDTAQQQSGTWGTTSKQ